DSERGLPGSINFYYKDVNERIWDNNFFVQAHYKQPLGTHWRFQTSAKYNYAFTRYRDINDKYASGQQVDLNTQQEYYGSASLLYQPWQPVTVTLTSDLTHSHLENNYVGGPNPKRIASQSVLAAQYKDTRLTATASLLGTYMTDRVVQGDRPADKKRLSPAASLSWRPFSESTFRIRMAYKDIFRVPTFTDLYYLRMGNTSLRPERATQYNLGLTWSAAPGGWLRYVSLSTDGYFNRVKDKIVALPTMYVWKMMNMGEVDIKGVDVNLSGEFPLPAHMSVLLAATYTYQYAVDVTDESAKNYKHQIPYTPRHTATASLSWENPWLNVSYLLTAVGDRYALPQNIESNRIDAYVEQSLTANREFQFHRVGLRVQGELLNLANVNYDVIQFYPMPGRSWRISVCVTY
ncbi:MAG: TonB-dependent receptor plug domain-containing protein, partial [Parabacteroides sp.]